MLRRAMVVVALAAGALAGPAPALAATWHGNTLCSVSGGRIQLTDPTDCVIETTMVTTTVSNPVARLSAKTYFADTRAVDTSKLSEYFIHVWCYRADGTNAYGLSAAHNLWPGITIAVITRGIFTPEAPGTFDCGVVAHLEGGSGAGTDYSIEDSQTGHYLTAYTYGGGVSSPGPNVPATTWPSPAYVTLTSSDPATQVVRTNPDWFSGPVSGHVSAVSNIQISRCSPGDYPAKCSHSQGGTAPVTVTVQMQAWQAISATSTTVCPGTVPLDITTTLTITYATHHDTVSQLGSFVPSSSCPGHMIVKVLIDVTTAGGWVYFGSAGSAVAVYGPTPS